MLFHCSAVAVKAAVEKAKTEKAAADKAAREKAVAATVIQLTAEVGYSIHLRNKLKCSLDCSLELQMLITQMEHNSWEAEVGNGCQGSKFRVPPLLLPHISWVERLWWAGASLVETWYLMLTLFYISMPNNC